MCSSKRAEEIQKKAMHKCVKGNPRSWWMSLTKPHRPFNYDFPSDHIPQGVTRCYWIPETEEENLTVYSVQVATISHIMKQVAQFELCIRGRS